MNVDHARMSARGATATSIIAADVCLREAAKLISTADNGAELSSASRNSNFAAVDLHLFPGRAYAKLRHGSKECPSFQNRLKNRLNSEN
jgi:hypothetical protein